MALEMTMWLRQYRSCINVVEGGAIEYDIASGRTVGVNYDVTSEELRYLACMFSSLTAEPGLFVGESISVMLSAHWYERKFVNE